MRTIVALVLLAVPSGAYANMRRVRALSGVMPLTASPFEAVRMSPRWPVRSVFDLGLLGAADVDLHPAVQSAAEQGPAAVTSENADLEGDAEGPAAADAPAREAASSLEGALQAPEAVFDGITTAESDGDDPPYVEEPPSPNDAYVKRLIGIPDGELRDRQIESAAFGMKIELTPGEAAELMRHMSDREKLLTFPQRWWKEIEPAPMASVLMAWTRDVPSMTALFKHWIKMHSDRWEQRNGRKDAKPLTPLFAAFPPGAARDQAVADSSHDLLRLEPIADTARVLSLASRSLRRRLGTSGNWPNLRFAEVMTFLNSLPGNESLYRAKFALLQSWLPVYIGAGKDGAWDRVISALARLPAGAEMDQLIDESLIWRHIPADYSGSLLSLVVGDPLKQRIIDALAG